MVDSLVKEKKKISESFRKLNELNAEFYERGILDDARHFSLRKRLSDLEKEFRDLEVKFSSVRTS